MSREKPTPDSADREVSPGGSPIFRHEATGDWQPAGGEEHIEQISAHIEAHLGPVANVLHEIVSDIVHVDVHVVMPTGRQPCIRLVTSGMSDLPMTTPDNPDVPRFAELMITLPPDWQLSQASFEDEAWYWPVRLLKSLARLPHRYGTWLGRGHTIPNGDPAEPYARNVAFAGAIILPPLTAPDAFRTLQVGPDRRITFYSVLPLFPAEMDLKLRKGTDALLDLFDAKHVNDAVDPARRDVTRKRFGLW
jgi:hypothetical protein